MRVPDEKNDQLSSKKSKETAGTIPFLGEVCAHVYGIVKRVQVQAKDVMANNGLDLLTRVSSFWPTQSAQSNANHEDTIHLLEQQIQADAKRTQRIEHTFNSVFVTLKRLKQRFYTEQGKQIDALWQSFSESEREAIIEAADSQLICPITKELLREPVVPADGRHYERYALQQWYDAYGQSCPYDRTKILTIPTELPVDSQLQEYVLKFLQTQQQKLHSMLYNLN